VHFPAPMADMVRGGYTFLQTKECRDCGELIYLFRTPRGRIGPFVKTSRGRFVSHFAVCPALRSLHAARASGAAGQGELFPVTLYAARGARRNSAAIETSS
jgi:hypothetical protein